MFSELFSGMFSLNCPKSFLNTMLKSMGALWVSAKEFENGKT